MPSRPRRTPAAGWTGQTARVPRRSRTAAPPGRRGVRRPRSPWRARSQAATAGGRAWRRARRAARSVRAGVPRRRTAPEEGRSNASRRRRPTHRRALARPRGRGRRRSHTGSSPGRAGRRERRGTTRPSRAAAARRPRPPAARAPRSATRRSRRRRRRVIAQRDATVRSWESAGFFSLAAAPLRRSDRARGRAGESERGRGKRIPWVAVAQAFGERVEPREVPDERRDHFRRDAPHGALQRILSPAPYAHIAYRYRQRHATPYRRLDVRERMEILAELPDGIS